MSSKRSLSKQGFLPRLPSLDFVGWLEAHRGAEADQTASAASNETRRGAPARAPVSARSETKAGSQEDQPDRKDTHRKDVPEVRDSKRGRLELAMAVTQSESSRSKARDLLVSNMYAKSSIAPQDALESTWRKFHIAWFGETVPMLPLDKDKMVAVSSMFRAGQYRSFRNYIYKVRDLRISEDYPWPPSLDRICKKCIRSVLRGIGPSQQAVDFNVEALHSLTISPRPIVPGGPWSPRECLLVGAFFMTREIELSGAFRRHVRMDRDKRICYWLLPATKADVMGRGTERSWGCVCKSKPGPCPFCSMDAHLNRMEEVFGSPDEHDELPLFPTDSGSMVTKESMIKSFEATIIAANALDKIKHGDKKITGHVCRVAGAKMLARLGLAVAAIMLMGRWGSDTVLRYLGDAPVESITRQYVERWHAESLDDKITQCAQGVNLESQLDEFSLQFTGLKDGLREAVDNYKHLLGELNSVKEQLQENMQENSARLVHNFDSKITHHASICEWLPPSAWRTRCGWEFTRHRNVLIGKLDSKFHGSQCPKCFRRKRTPDKEASSSESISD